MKQDQNWLAEMESRRRDDEPSPGQGMADLMRRTDEVLTMLSPEDGGELRAVNLRLTRAAEALASTVPEVLPLSDRWDDLCTLALVLGQRR